MEAGHREDIRDFKNRIRWQKLKQLVRIGEGTNLKKNANERTIPNSDRKFKQTT
jgi:hypothetical protein